MYQNNINCPQCGSALALNFRHSKLRACEHCGSTIFLEDDAVEFAGKQSVLSKEASLVQLQQPFRYKKQSYLPVGHVRYQYEDGFWDEWWVINNAGEGLWVTVDEGDFAFERQVTTPENISFNHFQLGDEMRGWIVTERGHAVCDGFEGELPELVYQGERFDYVHLSKPGGQLFSLEFFEKKTKAFEGNWADPFEIQVEG